MSLLLTLLLVAAAQAGDPVWLVPEPIAPGPGDSVTVALLTGTPPRPVTGSGSSPRFQRLWKNGRTWIDGPFVVDEPGLQLIAFASDASPSSRHYCKAMLVVGDAAASGALHLSELGHRLEIVPQTDPVALARSGGRISLQVLFDREPLADTVVEGVALGGSGEPQTATTDEIGLAALDLGRGDRWRIRVDHRQRGDQDDGSWFSSTLWLASGSGE